MTLSPRLLGILFVAVVAVASVDAQGELGAAKVTPNLVGNIERPLRYRPEGGDFVIENGTEFFNRPLYGGNTAFRVDGGDKPEFVLYLPGRGGNLRFGIRTTAGAKWLHDAAHILTRYRPGELRYEIRDSVLGAQGRLEIVAVAYDRTEGLAVRVEAHDVLPATEFVWAYGGINGQRGKRDGDIGTESVPISEWFQLRPDFCRDNRAELTATGFALHAKPATILGVASAGAQFTIGDAAHWNDLSTLLAPTVGSASAGPLETAERDRLKPALPIVVGRAALNGSQALFLSLQRRPTDSGGPASDDLLVYREVSAQRANAGKASSAEDKNADRGRAVSTAPLFTPEELPDRFAEAERHFSDLRSRVTIDTPDAFLNAAVGALNVAADAVWDEPQHSIMHGAIAWRTRLLGWRGPYALDALGWHDRARLNFTGWLRQQNTSPISTAVPPPDEKANLARNEAGLHTNGDLSNSHYDMNLVFIDALFRHLQWTGDLAFAKEAWPAIERHLAWERRLFRREFGPNKLPLYEAYAAIWASDDLQYSGGGAAHSSAYNYYENRQAARLARLIGADPAPYDREADLIARGMRELLWVTSEGTVAGGGENSSVMPVTARAGVSSVGLAKAEDLTLQLKPNDGGTGWFAEYKDWLGAQRVHPSAALWTFYHTLDSGLPTSREAWQMADQLKAEIPHLPVRGPGVPDGLWTLAESDWMPYDWSINNVVMAEAVHAALGLWQAGQPAEAWAIMKGSVVAAMYMGISPGNVGSMSYLDVYRRESQRDFADGNGVLSRALVEGLFGVQRDALAGVLQIAPGWPAEWDHASIRHPDFGLRFERHGDSDTYIVEQQLRERTNEIAAADRDARVGPDLRAGRIDADMQSARPEVEPYHPLAIRLRIVARRDRVAEVTVDGKVVPWRTIEDSVGLPRIEMLVNSEESGRNASPTVRTAAASTSALVQNITIRWAGETIRPAPDDATAFVRAEQGEMRWLNAPPARHDLSETPGARDAGLGLVPLDVSGAQFDAVDLRAAFNDRVTEIFKHEYRSPRSPFVSLALPKQGIGGWAGGVNRTATVDDSGLRAVAASNAGRVVLPNGVPFVTPSAADARNVVFASHWDNFPRETSIALSGHARGLYLLLAGSTNPMQSRFENGEIVVAYTDGSVYRLPLINPTNWWPIEQDYFIDDFQFRRPEALPMRIDLKSGRVRALEMATFKGRGGMVAGGAATVLALPLSGAKELKSLTLRATANDVVIGLMAATLVR